MAWIPACAEPIKASHPTRCQKVTDGKKAEERAAWSASYVGHRYTSNPRHCRFPCFSLLSPRDRRGFMWMYRVIDGTVGQCKHPEKMRGERTSGDREAEGGTMDPSILRGLSAMSEGTAQRLHLGSVVYLLHCFDSFMDNSPQCSLLAEGSVSLDITTFQPIPTILLHPKPTSSRVSEAPIE